MTDAQVAISNLKFILKLYMEPKRIFIFYGLKFNLKMLIKDLKYII